MLVLIAGVGIGRIEAVKANTELILHDRHAKVSLALAIENAVNLQARELRTALITTDVEMVKSELAAVEGADRQVAGAIDKLHATVTSGQGKATLATLVKTREDYMRHKAELVKLVAAQSLDEGGVYPVKSRLPTSRLSRSSRKRRSGDGEVRPGGHRHGVRRTRADGGIDCRCHRIGAWRGNGHHSLDHAPDLPVRADCADGRRRRPDVPGPVAPRG